MGLTALMLLQHARPAARFAPCGDLILLDDQDRTLWNRTLIAKGLALLDKTRRHVAPGAYHVQDAIVLTGAAEAAHTRLHLDRLAKDAEAGAR